MSGSVLPGSRDSVSASALRLDPAIPSSARAAAAAAEGKKWVCEGSVDADKEAGESTSCCSPAAAGDVGF